MKRSLADENQSRKSGFKKRKALKEKCNRSRTRHQKVESQKLYQEAHKEVTRFFKEDKWDYVSSLVAQAEVAAASGNMKRPLWRHKEASGEVHSYQQPGKRQRRKEDDKLRWVDHFCEILIKPSTETPSTPEAPSELYEAPSELEVNCERLSKEEIVKAIKKLKSGKAAGPVNIPPEALKADPSQLYELARCMNSLKRFGKRKKCQLSGTKATSSTNFPRKEVWENVRTISNSPSNGISVYVNFVDFEKAFDNLDRKALWNLMMYYGIPGKFTRIIKLLRCDEL